MNATTTPPLHPGPVRIYTEAVVLDGELTVPHAARGAIVFAHGSGSSRHSPRNRSVARTLNEAGFATLLMDLLTRDEETVDIETKALRFDIDLLAQRLIGAIDWLNGGDDERLRRIGCFGASTGAAAALVAASERPEIVRAVVSRGGRPDLAGAALPRVKAPTLLIVGGHDSAVIPVNTQALAALGSDESRLEIVAGATHLFEEPGAMEQVAKLAMDWFARYLGETESVR